MKKHDQNEGKHMFYWVCSEAAHDEATLATLIAQPTYSSLTWAVVHALIFCQFWESLKIFNIYIFILSKSNI